MLSFVCCCLLFRSLSFLLLSLLPCLPSHHQHDNNCMCVGVHACVCVERRATTRAAAGFFRSRPTLRTQPPLLVASHVCSLCCCAPAPPVPAPLLTLFHHPFSCCWCWQSTSTEGVCLQEITLTARRQSSVGIGNSFQPAIASPRLDLIS